MGVTIRTKLSIMMFLQFFVWGAWNVTMGTYLLNMGFDGIAVADAYSTTSWAAIFSPVIVGVLADRFFSAQRVMAILHIIGAALLWWISSISDPSTFFWVLLAYALCYMPTLALANSISFHQMEDPSLEFPRIRAMGTLGWIVVGLIIGFGVPALWGDSIEATNVPLRIAAAISLILGVYAFTLPDTPPGNADHKPSFTEMLGLDTLAFMKERSFAVFVIGSLLICIPLSFYYNFANAFLNESGMANAAGKMTLGQLSEVLFLLLIPAFFARLGVKRMLLIGMAAWVLRYILFAMGNNESMVFALYGGIILHGVCFDFFFVTGQIYVDKTVSKKMRASAQGFIHLITYGVGMVIGSKASGLVVDHYTNAQDPAAEHYWAAIWSVPAAMAGVVLVLFMIFFKDPTPSFDKFNTKAT